MVYVEMFKIGFEAIYQIVDSIYVSVNGIPSNLISLSHGIPQGSILDT